VSKLCVLSVLYSWTICTSVYTVVKSQLDDLATNLNHYSISLN